MIASILAADRLEAVLRAENMALLRQDVAAAGAFLPEKLAAAQGLGSAGPLPQTPAAAIIALRLRDLGHENRRLLEKAILVQSRVVELVANAAREACRPDTRYGANGAATRNAAAAAFVSRA